VVSDVEDEKGAIVVIDGGILADSIRSTNPLRTVH
jgi:hypothetical protein